MRCTRLTIFRGYKLYNWVWIKRHYALEKACAGTLNGYIPGRLNILFKLKSKDRIVYQMANISLLQYIGGGIVQDAEGMLRIRWYTKQESIVVPIVQIEGMVPLLLLDLGETWLVNNRIDLKIWDALYD